MNTRNRQKGFFDGEPLIIFMIVACIAVLFIGLAGGKDPYKQKTICISGYLFVLSNDPDKEVVQILNEKGGAVTCPSS